MTEAPAASAPRNRIGLTKADYDGARTTLCPGCGHNAHMLIVNASDVAPAGGVSRRMTAYSLAKLCSSCRNNGLATSSDGLGGNAPAGNTERSTRDGTR